jgi:hypothetical protein
MRGAESRTGTLCVLLVAVFYLSTIREGHDWGDDFSQYILHAANLASGAPYAPTRYLFNPDNPLIGPAQYPPGFPIALAPIVRTFGLDLWPMKAEVVLFFVAALFLIHRIVRSFMPTTSAAAVVLLVGLNPSLWALKDQILSDVPFLFFFMATVLCLIVADDEVWRARHRVALSVLGGVAMYAAYATRVVGAVLLPSLIVRDLIVHRRLTREGLIAAATFVMLAGVHHVTWGETSYSQALAITASTVVVNIVSYLRWLSDLWDNGYIDLARRVLFLVTLAFATFGYLSLWQQQKAILPAVAVLFYLAVIIAWPFAQDTRFLLPAIPIYVACIALGASSIDRALARRGAKQGIVLGVFLAMAGVSYIARYSTLSFGPLQEGIAKRESVELFDFIKTSTHPADVIVFSRPRALALFGERTVTPPSRPADPCALWLYVRRVGATYLVTGPDPANENAKYLARFVRDFAPNLREVMRNADVAVYRVESAPATCANVPITGFRR